MSWILETTLVQFWADLLSNKNPVAFLFLGVRVSAAHSSLSLFRITCLFVACVTSSPVVGKGVCVHRVVSWIGSTGEAVIDVTKHLILSLALPRAAVLTHGSPSPWFSATRKLRWWVGPCPWLPICSPSCGTVGGGECQVRCWDQYPLST